MNLPNFVPDFIATFLRDNQFASGGLFIGLIGSAAALLRSYPVRMFNWIKSRFLFTVEVLDRDGEVYHWICNWAFENQALRKRVRSITLRIKWEGEEQRVYSIPTPGNYLFWYEGRPWRFSLERQEGGVNDGKIEAFKETIRLTTVSRSGQCLLDIVNKARGALTTEHTIKVYTCRYDGWNLASSLFPRSRESVYVDHDILADVDRFVAARDWYRERGVPYRRGYLFHGPPGTGKSSMSLAIASHLNWSVHCLNLSSNSLTDTTLSSLISELPERSILLIEDIDCARVATRDQSPEKVSGVTFSHVLNTIDGLLSPEGRIIIMTTNAIEKLDPALIRPGRVDQRYYFGLATPAHAESMFSRFHPGANGLCAEFAASVPPEQVSHAALQEHLLKYRDDPQAAVDAVKELLA